MSRTFVDAGCEVVLLHEKCDQDLGFPLDIRLEAVNTGGSKSGIQRYWKWHKGVKKHLAEIKPEIAIAGDLFSLGAIGENKSINRKIFDSRELYSKMAGLVKKSFHQLFWSWFEKKYITAMDSILVTADGDRDFLHNCYGELPVELIYNFPSSTMVPTANFSLKEKYNLPENAAIFIYQGVLHKGRGIRKMMDLLDEFENAVIVILGDGIESESLKRYAEIKKVQKKVVFTGSIPNDELLKYTLCADIGFSLIQPVSESYKQALPNKLFEYALCGVPVIASDLPELNKFITKFNLGELVNPNKKEDHIQAVKKILSGNTKYSGENHELTWESQSDKFLKTVGIHG